MILRKLFLYFEDKEPEVLVTTWLRPHIQPVAEDDSKPGQAVTETPGPFPFLCH